MNNLETKIKFILEKNKKTIKQLVQEIEMSEQNLYKIFKRDSIETKHLQKIADVLQISICYFFEDNFLPGQVTNSGNKVNQNDSKENEIEKLKIKIEGLEKEIESSKREVENYKERILELKEMIEFLKNK